MQCHLTRRRWTRFASNPFLLSLSFWLCLNQSIYFQIASWVQEKGLLSLLGWNIKSMHTPIYRVGFNFYLVLMGMKLALSVVKDILLQIQGPLYSWSRDSDGEWMCWINANLRKLGCVSQALRHRPVVILHLLPWGEQNATYETLNYLVLRYNQTAAQKSINNLSSNACKTFNLSSCGMGKWCRTWACKGKT